MVKSHFAVIGNPITHSLSPMIHGAFARQFNHFIEYQKIRVEKNDFSTRVRRFFASGGKGLNITLPYKKLAFEISEQLTEYADLAQAVNTLWMKENVIHGDNTDGPGLICDLKKSMSLSSQSILIIGAGGAASGILPALMAQNPKRVCLTNRTYSNALKFKKRFQDIEVIQQEQIDGDFDLIIHATSVGLEGNRPNLPSKIWRNKPFCYDLTYQSGQPTPFVQLAREHGCEGQDGLGMLVEQAALSYYLWQGVRPDTAQVLQLLKKSFHNRA